MRTHTSPSIVKLAAVGAVAGLVSGLVKLGWENILPPRTPERDATNPPQTFLQQHGLTPAETHATYTYSGHQVPWVSLLVHFGFSSSLGALYAVAGHYVPLFKLGYVGTWCLGRRAFMGHACTKYRPRRKRSASGRASVRSSGTHGLEYRQPNRHQ